MTTPDSIRPGDKIAIISPASVVNPDYIDGAARFFEAEGLSPVIMPHAKGPAHGSFAAPDYARLRDLTDAYSDPDIKAILCARGGYGCNHLLTDIPLTLVSQNPKWLIGFSDISALHALSLHAGVVSLHAPMARHLTLLPPDHYCTRALMRILSDGLPTEYIVPHHPLDIPGFAQGPVIGGNLAVINGLAATPFDPFAILESLPDDTKPILFIEDISEAIYAVERMLIRLRLSGALSRLGGIVVGAFTDYRPDRNHPDMYSMISDLIRPLNLGIPVAFGFPAGHIDDNLPVPLGAFAALCVENDAVTLSFSDSCS